MTKSKYVLCKFVLVISKGSINMSSGDNSGLICKHLFLTLCNSPSLLADITSLTLYLAAWQAKASPIPLDAPVIHITLPLSSPIIKMFFQSTFNWQKKKKIIYLSHQVFFQIFQQ